MKYSNSLIFQTILWLFVFSYPLFAFHDQIREPILSWLWHPFTLVFPFVFALVFYGNWKVLIPKFLETNKIGIYLLCFLGSLATIIWLRPMDRWIFRNGDRLRFPSHAPRPEGLESTIPVNENFFLDRTSIFFFLILWGVGLGIWFYEKKIKRLFAALIKQIEAGAVEAPEKTEKTRETVAPSSQDEKNTAQPPADNLLTVHVEYEQIKIPFDDIEYIEAFDSYVKIYLSNSDKPLLTRLTLRAISEKLLPEKFLRIHRSFIVSADKVAIWTASKVRLKSGQELPIGRRFKGDFNQ
jgi:hypothetical protein